MAWNYPLTFDTKEPFWACVVSSLPFTQIGFLLLFVLAWLFTWDFTSNKDWLFTLFLLLFPFPRANRVLAVNSWTGALLFFASVNAKRRLTSCKFPAWSQSISHLTWGSKRRGHYHIICDAKAPIGLWARIHLGEKLYKYVEECPQGGQVWRKKQDNWLKKSKDPEELHKWFNHFLTMLLLTGRIIHTILSVYISALLLY